ncbi:MAG: hypothetical protein Q7T60_17170 [Sphingopyxis sp.]|nr:hypothetical protein [Sphingopyxis sp.]
MIAWAWAKLSGWAAGAGALIALGLGIWIKGRSEGAAAARAAEENRKQEAIATKRKLDDEIDNLAPADRDKRFDSWVRKD